MTAALLDRGHCKAIFRRHAMLDPRQRQALLILQGEIACEFCWLKTME
jgi:hypothetical protein